jgi:hypothetical protein
MMAAPMKVGSLLKPMQDALLNSLDNPRRSVKASRVAAWSSPWG